MRQKQEAILVPEVPLGHHTLLWEDQDLPIVPNSSGSLHPEAAAETGHEADPKPRCQLTAPPQPYPAVALSREHPHVPAGHRDEGGNAANEDF